MKPAGMTYEDFKTKGMLRGKWVERSYESKGFGTPSKKVEIYSSRFEDWGYDPLPIYREGKKDLSKDEQGLILTSAKDPNYFHSAYRNLPSLRKLSPDPEVWLHPDTAGKLGVQEGEWVFIETRLGELITFDGLHDLSIVSAA